MVGSSASKRTSCHGVLQRTKRLQRQEGPKLQHDPLKPGVVRAVDEAGECSHLLNFNSIISMPVMALG